jgi:hypothetical protein
MSSTSRAKINTKGADINGKLRQLVDRPISLGDAGDSRRPQVRATASFCLRRSGYAAAIARTLLVKFASETFMRRRIAKPTAPMPRIIIAQVAGSGTAPLAVASKL